ncbi:MAG: anhydro-N-acetylmuramic acid kinase [Planctomycetota bacterium]
MADQDTVIRRVVGCMTGTSLDGIDVALGLVRGRGLEGMSVGFGGMVSLEMPSGLREGLLRIAEGGAVTGLEVLRLRRALGELHAEAVAELVEQVGGEVDLVVAHGQTVWHAPGDESGAMSWQLFDPWPVVRRLGVPVCYDLRQADLIAGGQGAPITPVADWVMYRGVSDLVVNLGGIVNVTRLDREVVAVRAKDVCPCNLLLDSLCQRLFGLRFDEDGGLALRGKVDEKGARRIVYEIAQAIGPGGQSLGREQFGEAWVDRWIERLVPRLSPEDVLASAALAVAAMISCEAIGFLGPSRLVLAGGGVKNRALMRAIREQNSGKEVLTSDEVGIPAEAREALGMAVLGALSWDGVPVTLRGVTGAMKPGVAGAWVYPAGHERSG